MISEKSVHEIIQELDTWMSASTDSRELRRALAVKLTFLGWAYRAVASLLNVSISFVSKWKKMFEEGGVEALKLGYQGSKSYLNHEQKQQTLQWLNEQEYWSVSELECYLAEQFDVEFKSLTSYYEILKNAGISWQKAQIKNPKQDLKKVQRRNQEISKILEKELPAIKSGTLVVYAIDEVHLVEGDLVSHLWGKTKERINLQLENPKNRQTYYGALNLVTQELVLEKYEAGNAESTVDFLRKLLAMHPNQKVVIFWDGAKYHTGEVMKSFLEEINGNLAPQQWKLVCNLFAPYFPKGNPIESIWLSLKSLLRMCHRFCRKFKVMKSIFELFAKVKLYTVPNLTKYDAFSCLV
jgi:transposase